MCLYLVLNIYVRCLLLCSSEFLFVCVFVCFVSESVSLISVHYLFAQ